MVVRFLKLKTNWNIQSEFSQFVTLNSSGDPVEAAENLDTAENHIVVLKTNCWASARNCHRSSSQNFQIN